MAFLSTVRTSYRIGRAADRPRRARRPLLVLAAQALGTVSARATQAVAALRSLALTLAGFGLIDAAAFHFGQWVGLGVSGLSLLILEALTSSDTGSPR